MVVRFCLVASFILYHSLTSSSTIPPSFSTRNPEESSVLINDAVSTSTTFAQTDTVEPSSASLFQNFFERIRRLPALLFEYEDDRPRRTFPEVDSRGFDEDIFDEGFGEWYPMKRF